MTVVLVAVPSALVIGALAGLLVRAFLLRGKSERQDGSSGAGTVRSRWQHRERARQAAEDGRRWGAPTRQDGAPLRWSDDA